MALKNTSSTYGNIAKGFHWISAALIVFLLALGVYMQRLPNGNPTEVAHTLWAFSLHKTLGLSLLFIAILRVIWAAKGPKPAPLHSDNKLELFAADLVHWLLYIAIILTPIAGWFRHAASVGFAHIWWPFGQDLFFIPKSEPLAEFFSTLHFILVIMMTISILAHIGGAMKHLVIDRDKTLQRMLPFVDTSGLKATGSHPHTPQKVAFGVVAILILLAGAITFSTPASQTTLTTASSGWIVDHENSNLGISIVQLGSVVDGDFSNWTADIQFNPDNIENATVTVTIAMDSLSLGSVTTQAQGAEYLAIGEFAKAVFTSDNFTKHDDGGYQAKGTLQLRGVSAPLDISFTLDIENNVAHMQGSTEIVRLDHNIGAKEMPDDSTLGFIVAVHIDLLATQN